jgi:hypothetical protein
MKLGGLVLLLCTTAAAQADVLVERGHRATLSVDYSYESVGSSPGSIASAEWRVKRSLTTSVTLEAGAPMAMAQMQAPDAAQVAELEARAAAGQQVAAQLAPNMGNIAAFAAGAEALVAKCGDDEECFTREAQKFLQGSNAAELGQAAGVAQQGLGSAFAPDAPRYQVWQQIAQLPGTYLIDEALSVRSRDPICIGQPRDTCTIDELRTGGGVAPGGSGRGPAAFEVDSQGKTLMMMLPLVTTGLKYKRTFTSTHPEDESGESQAELGFPGALALPASHASQPTDVRIELQPLTMSFTGDTLPTTGTRTFEATGDSGERVKLTVAWRLAVQ